MTVIVIAGGLSHERDVSLRSGRRVSQALRNAGREVIQTDVGPDLLPLIAEHPDAVVLPLLHGGLGENGALREVLELMGVPFVGSTGAASRRTFDKSLATWTVARAGVATPKQVALPQDIFQELGAARIMEGIADFIGFPLVVKPSRSGSALGVTMVRQRPDLASALVSAYAYGTVAVIEEFIEGTEVAVTIIDEGDGPFALPAVEIHPAGGMYDYEARYTAGATRFVTPAKFPEHTLTRIADVALTAHEALGLRHLSRMDILVRADGEPVFIEANVAPGMTETSLAPLAFEAAGRSIADVFGALLDQLR